MLAFILLFMLSLLLMLLVMLLSFSRLHCIFCILSLSVFIGCFVFFKIFIAVCPYKLRCIFFTECFFVVVIILVWCICSLCAFLLFNS